MLRALIRAQHDAVKRFLRDRRDRAGVAALAQALPWFDGIDAEIRIARDQLHPAWSNYVTTVSLSAWAASLELSALLLAASRLSRPRRILDLGSGFSSYVLRGYAVESGAASVVTVDDNPAWLDRSRRFLESQGLPTQDMWIWEDFSASTPEPFDLVLHDLGTMRVRATTLPRVLEMAAADGLVFLDDLHPKGTPYCDIAPAACRRAGRRLYSLRPLTLDGIGRFAGVAIPRR